MKEFFRKLLTFFILTSVVLSLLPTIRPRAVYGNGYIGGQNGDGMGIYAHGVDISSWQGGEVDFRKIKEQGYSFVILRAGYSVYMDRYFERNYAAAKEAGLHVGVYLYSYADTVSAVLKEAEALKGWIKGKKLEYPVYYDMEEPETHGKMSASALTELSMAFLDSMADDGWLVGLYSCKSWLEGKLQTDIICEKYECWMGLYLPSGEYGTYDKYDEYCGIWQYSSTGSVEGVPGNVDMNVAFKNYPGICMQYGLNGYSASGESIALIDNEQFPSVIATGESVPISGRIVSKDGELTDVAASVLDIGGNLRSTAFAKPDAQSFDLSTFTEKIKISDLPEGEYVYRLTASNSKETRVLCQAAFAVSKYGLLARGVSAPRDPVEGAVYIPQGQVEASTAIMEVSIRIETDDGIQVLSASAAPQTSAYALPTLASALNLQALTMGRYRYCVTVTTQLGTQTVLDEIFHVWVKDDPVTLSGTVLNSEYPLNALSGLSGTVQSKFSNLQNVSVSIYGKAQDSVLMRAETSGEKTVALKELGESLQLENLSYGTYICMVEATNDGGPVVLLEKQFTIRPDALSLCGADTPVHLVCGDSFLISGAVASDYSPLEFVSLSVLDERGQVVFDATTSPGVMVYDLSSLSGSLRFSDLDVGVYTLRISAKNETTHQVLYNSGFHVTDLQDCVDWVGAHCSPNGISYASYDVMRLYGRLESSQSDILCVKAQVFTQDGELMNAAELTPMARHADISEFNNILRLSALTAGKYQLVITAQNASGEFIMLDETFYISDCTHRDVRSGVVHEQRCDRLGAICDSRCSLCGERTQSGTVIASDAHTWSDDSCIYCGKSQMRTFTLQRTQSYRHMGRYLFAYCEGNRWYALNVWGETVEIDAPGDNGALDAGAELLWTANVRGGELYFSNPYGLRLHLDSDKIAVASGTTNTIVEADAILSRPESGIRIYTEDAFRSLIFKDGKFQTGSEWMNIILFELPLK